MSLTAEISKKAVRRNDKYNDVVNLLWMRGEGGQRDDKIFNDIKDLIIFAAMVGKKNGIREPVDTKNSTGILLETFSGAGSARESRLDQHNIIFMFALFEHRDMDYMRDEKVEEVIKEFEEYSNGGLSIIKGWLAASASNSLCLLDEMVNLMPSNDSGLNVPDNPF